MFLFHFHASFSISVIQNFFEINLLSLPGHSNLRICIELAKICVFSIENALNDKASSSYKKCDCLDNCNDIKYFYEIQIDKILPKHQKNYTDDGNFALESEVLIYMPTDEYFGVS